MPMGRIESPPSVLDSSVMNEKSQSQLAEGTLIERIGSFRVAVRPGYGETRTERGIVKKVSKRLYEKRLGLSRFIVDNHEYYEPRSAELFYSALVSQGFSPHSVDRWDIYVSMLSDFEGGWDIFIRELERDVRAYDDANRRMFVAMFLFCLGMIFSLVLSALSNVYLPPLASTTLGLTSLFVVFFIAAKNLPLFWHDKKGKSKLLGDTKKKFTSFFPASRALGKRKYASSH